MRRLGGCGDEEDGRIGLSSWHHYIFVLCSLLYALLVEHTVCHEPISVLVNIYIKMIADIKVI